MLFATDFGSSSLERLSRQAQGRGRLEPIEERVIPIQRRYEQQQQQPEASTSDIRRHYAVYRRRASNVEPSLSSPSLSPSGHAMIVGGEDLARGFCVSVGRHSRGFSLSLRPQQPARSSSVVDQQRPLVSVVIPTAADASLRQPSPRQPSPSNIHDNIQTGGDGYMSADDQPGRYTIYQPLMATGTSAGQQLYSLPGRRLLLPPSASPSGLVHVIFRLSDR